MYLYDLIGKMVKINHEGPEARKGRLLSVERDYLVLNTKEDGVVYYNLQHVKSIAELDDGKHQHHLHHLPDDPTFIRAFNFWFLLRALEGESIQINRGGLDKLEGKVVGFGPGFLLLESKKERIRVPIFHIKSVSLKRHGDHHGHRHSGRHGNRNGDKNGKNKGKSSNSSSSSSSSSSSNSSNSSKKNGNRSSSKSKRS